jgi:hypothetical protein
VAGRNFRRPGLADIIPIDGGTPNNQPPPAAQPSHRNPPILPKSVTCFITIAAGTGSYDRWPFINLTVLRLQKRSRAFRRGRESGGFSLSSQTKGGRQRSIGTSLGDLFHYGTLPRPNLKAGQQYCLFALGHLTLWSSHLKNVNGRQRSRSRSTVVLPLRAADDACSNRSSSRVLCRIAYLLLFRLRRCARNRAGQEPICSGRGMAPSDFFELKPRRSGTTIPFHASTKPRHATKPSKIRDVDFVRVARAELHVPP